MPPGDELIHPSLPAHVKRVLGTLVDAGHEVALVGGSVRDLVGDDADGTDDWDVATSARPEEVAALFADATWENRFGTVTILGPEPVEVTSYRTEGGYSDRRRPDEVRFGASLEEDLARRDFTMNADRLGADRRGRGPRPGGRPVRRTRAPRRPDPADGRRAA